VQKQFYLFYIANQKSVIIFFLFAVISFVATHVFWARNPCFKRGSNPWCQCSVSLKSWTTSTAMPTGSKTRCLRYITHRHGDLQGYKGPTFGTDVDLHKFRARNISGSCVKKRHVRCRLEKFSIDMSEVEPRAHSNFLTEFEKQEPLMPHYALCTSAGITTQQFSLSEIGSTESCHNDRLCGLVVRVPGYRSRDPGSIPGTTRFSEK
jgi:hypothetical protein